MSQINIGGLTIDKFYLGNSSDVKIYIGEIKLYPKDGPQPVVSCYEVISTPMTSYASTTYDSVYSLSDAKWYMKNNLSQYEEYGVYDIVENISSATTYNGKLAIVGTTEYQYSGGSWSVVGTYGDDSVTYTIDSTHPSPYVGQELATTFKIPYADVEALGGRLNLRIRTADGDLRIRIDMYRYSGIQSYRGTVTNDGEYYYYALPSEAPQSVIIDDIGYFDSTPIHLIVGSKQTSVEYSAKTAPSSALTYSSVEEMEAASCPTVGVGQYCSMNGQVYKYTANEEWTTVQDSEFFVKQVYDDGRVGVLGCGYSDTLNVGVLGNKSGDVPNVEPTLNVYIGGCVDTIGESALYGLKNMTACTIGNGTKRIMTNAFISCISLSSLTIPNTVEIIDSKYTFGNESQNEIPWWKSYSANTSNHYGNIVYINDVAVAATSTTVSTFNFKENTKCIAGFCFYNCKNFSRINIPSTVKYIGDSAFYGCSSFSQLTLNEGLEIIEKEAFNQCQKLTSVTIPNSVTSIGGSAFSYCSGLTSVTCLAENPPELGDTAVFYNSTCPIYVPAESVDAYKSATNWSTYASRIKAIPLQWVSIDSGDTIPKGNIYGVKISSQNAGRYFGNGFEIGTDSDNCAWFGGGKPTRAPQFTAYFYTITNGVSTLENSWDNGDKEFIFSNYSGANYYYEDGTKTAPYAIQLYMYA